ncbi:hypothetical protein McaMca56_003411 [Microsporum canis]
MELGWMKIFSPVAPSDQPVEPSFNVGLGHGSFNFLRHRSNPESEEGQKPRAILFLIGWMDGWEGLNKRDRGERGRKVDIGFGVEQGSKLGASFDMSDRMTEQETVRKGFSSANSSVVAPVALPVII